MEGVGEEAANSDHRSALILHFRSCTQSSGPDQSQPTSVSLKSRQSWFVCLITDSGFEQLGRCVLGLSVNHLVRIDTRSA